MVKFLFRASTHTRALLIAVRHGHGRGAGVGGDGSDDGGAKVGLAEFAQTGQLYRLCVLFLSFFLHQIRTRPFPAEIDGRYLFNAVSRCSQRIGMIGPW
jgi:hypothetical protein